MRIILRPAAEADIAVAEAWYANVDVAVLDAFLIELDRTMERIAKMPQQFPDIGGARRALLHRFPYAVYFLLTDSERAVVLAILHQHQDPERWKRRVRDENDAG